MSHKNSRPAPPRAGVLLLLLLSARHAASEERPARLGERAAAASITAEVLRAHVRFLSDDILGGRQPGSEGDRIARTYLATQMEALGLLPAGEEKDGRRTYFQWVPLVGMRSRPMAPPEFLSRATTVPVKVMVADNEVVLVSGEQTPSTRLDDAEVVFVGYGITAPEYKWDDYKGADLRGKVLLMMNSDPDADPALFGGQARVYYGRWEYKYAEAARRGAAGAIIIHTDRSASYPWSVVVSSWGGENFEAPEKVREGKERLRLRGWLTETASRRIARAGGHDLDALQRAAEGRGFHPVPLGVRLSVKLRTELRRLYSANVLGLLQGSDARLRGESVVLTAHLDHLGQRGPQAAGEDTIYNGALDNATGLAALLGIARAAAAGPAPRRTLLFSAVTAEEDGLLGSRHLVANLPAEAGRPIAHINIDGLNIFGRSPQVVQIGRGKSTLDALLDQAAAQQGRRVVGDPMPERGSFYRSDQLSFARAGIPSIYLGIPADIMDVSGKLLGGAGREQVERYIKQHYHRPSDELREEWSWGGAVLDAQLLYALSLRLSALARPPSFLPGDEFARPARQD